MGDAALGLARGLSHYWPLQFALDCVVVSQLPQTHRSSHVDFQGTTNRELHLDPKDGRIQGDPEAMKMWGREYEKGWAPHV
jgi:hypothetical protein